jgi:type I restriction enzyme, S subunit
MNSTPANWHTVTLNDVCIKITDGAHASPKSVENGMPMASVKDLSSFGINFNTCRRISRADYEKLVRQGCQPLRDDVLIAKDGASALDTVCVMKKNLDVVLLSSVAILRPNQDLINPLYLRYYLDSGNIRQYIKNAFTTGAAIPRVVLKDFKLVRMLLPPLPTQRKIASILSAYDDLIENNQRRIKILGEMAQNLYREWFVKFRFPGHENVRFVDSPLGRIPERWEVVKLGEHLIALESGKRPKGGARDQLDGVPSVGAENITGIGRHNYQNEKYVSREFFESMRKGVVKDGDVALYKDGAYIGRSSYFRDGFPHTSFCVNEHVFLLRTNGEHLTQNLLYLWLQEPKTVSDIRATNANAAQPGINQAGVKGLFITVPPKEICQQFDNLIEPSLALIIRLAKRNIILHRTRDLLLPKLISGEVDVSELDVTIPEEN